MNKLNLNSKLKGYKRHISHCLKTNKNIFVGSIDYKLDICINNKYTLNKYFKFNINLSNNIYNNVLYNYKKINNE